MRDADNCIERRIMIGLISDTDYLRKIAAVYTPGMLMTTTATMLAGWCLGYYKQYGRAPMGDIEGIYTAHLKSGIDEEEAEGIEDLLSGMSSEHAKDGNPEFLLDETLKHFNRQIIRLLGEECSNVIGNGDIGNALESIRKFEPIAGGNSLQSQLASVMYTSTEFRAREIPRPRRLLRPWLAQSSLNMIYGPRGVGKTQITSIIGIALTRSEQEDIEIGAWVPRQRAKTLYLDGEMPAGAMQKRIDRLCLPLPPEDSEHPLIILSAQDLAQQHHRQISLAREEDRAAIYGLVKDEGIELVVLDNIAALSSGLNENDKFEWDPVNQWLLSLRHAGIAVVAVHHAGKSGQQRGTSGREDAMDTIINVSYPSDYDKGKDFAYMQISFEKSRLLQPGDDKAPMTLRIVEHPDIDGGLTWESAEATGQRGKKQVIMVDLLRGRKPKEIINEYGITASYISHIRADMIEARLIDKHGRVTEAGERLIERVGDTCE
jgi:hypothetical protein